MARHNEPPNEPMKGHTIMTISQRPFPTPTEKRAATATFLTLATREVGETWVFHPVHAGGNLTAYVATVGAYVVVFNDDVLEDIVHGHSLTVCMYDKHEWDEGGEPGGTFTGRTLFDVIADAACWQPQD